MGIVSAYFTYRFGRRKQIDSLILEKTVELSKDMSSLLQEIHPFYTQTERLWDSNFKHIEFHEAINAFERYPMYDDIKQQIDETIKKEEKLQKLCRMSAIYLKPDFRNLVDEYILLGKFIFQHDSAGMVDNYYEKYFENLKRTSKDRAIIYGKLDKQFHKLIR